MKNFNKRFTVLLISVVLILISVSPAFARSYLPGDASEDRELTVLDSTVIQKYIAGFENIKINSEDSDFNGDGKITVVDATQIQKKLVGLDYDCFIYPDGSYKKGVGYGSWSDGELPEENTVDFDEEYRANFSYFDWDDMENGKGGMYLITSEEQFFALFGACSPYFNNTFFSEKALICWLRPNSEWNDEGEILSVAVQDNALYVYRLWTSTNMQTPTFAYKHYFYSVNKTDIEGVTELRFRSRLEIVYV